MITQQERRRIELEENLGRIVTLPNQPKLLPIPVTKWIQNQYVSDGE
jgi:hypothetical protein